MKKAVTIKDIAEVMGVHHVTVSRALRNTGSVKKETGDLIRHKAKELGYKPNLLAQEFRNKRSNVLAVIVPDLQVSFFSKFVSNFMRIAQEAGYTVMIFQSSEKPCLERKIIDSLMGYRVSGVVASITKDTIDGSPFDALKSEGIACVFFDRAPEQTDASKVIVDNFKGAYDAVTAMVKSGKERIAYISTHYQHKIFLDRLSGYRKAIEDHGLSYKKEIVSRGDLFIKDGMALAKKLLLLNERPNGILVFRDEIGIGIIKYLKTEGVRVPEDVAVIGFDNDPMGLACDPELTTIEQSIPCMAKYSFNMVVNQIKEEAFVLESKVIEPKIIFRGSV